MAGVLSSRSLSSLEGELSSVRWPACSLHRRRGRLARKLIISQNPQLNKLLTYTRQPRTRSFMVQIVKLRDTPLRANASSLPLTIVPCSSGHSPSTNTDNLVLSPTSPSTVNLVPTCTLITHNVYKLGWATTLLNTCSSKITTKPHQLDSYRKPINNGKPNLPTKESTTVPHGSPALIMPNSQANGPNRSLDLTLLMP